MPDHRTVEEIAMDKSDVGSRECGKDSVSVADRWQPDGGRTFAAKIRASAAAVAAPDDAPGCLCGSVASIGHNFYNRVLELLCKIRK